MPSEHEVPSVAIGFEHGPLVGSHVPATWHASAAVHVTGLLPVHVPFWHESVCVHALPSLQAVPFALLVAAEQTPVDVLQVPAIWHELAAHTTGLAPTHVPPALHESVWVHALPSLQDAPAATGEHTPFFAAPRLQALQSFVAPPPQSVSQHRPSTQKPLWHELFALVPPVQACP